MGLLIIVVGVGMGVRIEVGEFDGNMSMMTGNGVG